MESPPVLRFGRFELQAERRLLTQDGEAVSIGARAFDLLLALARRRDRVVGKSELLDLVWPGLVVEENNLPVQVRTLRKVLGPQAIATIPGRGYRFTAEVEDDDEDGATSTTSAPSRSPPTSTPISTTVPTTQKSADARGAPVGNLAGEPSPLYGREDDLRAVRSLIESHRLVTLVGAGGIGKTTLAQALARQSLDGFEDGVWLVELAPVIDESRVAGTLAGALGIALGADASADALARLLAASSMLIVLDNCEHLLNATAALATALHTHAPGVHVLCTSQEALKVVGENVHRLGALALPDAADLPSARRAGALALFEARARAAQPSFKLGEENVAAVVDICRRLDGIPLAIELAAARVTLLGVDGLRARLDERFRILTGGARLALKRHQTLLAALEWSHGLLSSDEQAVYRRLGVFVGSFSLESAQHVAADENLDEWSVLDQLGALVDKSLVSAEPGDVPRYRLLETNRAFALEKLQQAAETEAVRRRHAHALLAVFEDSRRVEHLLAVQSRLDRYLPDLDNARAALDGSASPTADPRLHIALAGAVAWIWLEAGLRPEGFRRTRAAIAAIESDTEPALEARLLASWAWLAHPIVGVGELHAMERTVALYRQIGDRQSLFIALCTQARFLPYVYQIEAAQASLDEAGRLYDADWPNSLRGNFLQARSYLLNRQGRFEEATVDDAEIHRRAVAAGDQRRVLSALINLEQSVAALGRLDESVQRGRELMEMMRQDRSLRSGNEHFVLVNLNMSLIQLGRVDEALEISRKAYAAAAKLGRVLDIVEQCGLLALKRGRVDDAARILGRADKSFATIDVRRDPVEQRILDALVRGLMESLPAADLALLKAEGETMSDDDAVQLGLRD